MATALTARGEVLGSTALRSAGEACVRLVPERTSAEPGELVFVDVAIADTDGVVESRDDRTLEAHVSGGTLLAFGSARPRTEERYDTGTHTTYFGCAQAVIRIGSTDATLSVRDQTGEAHVRIACHPSVTNGCDKNA